MKNAANFVEQYWILDFDRCLANTELLYGAYAELIQDETSISIKGLHEVRTKTEAKGASFDLLSYVKTVLSGEERVRLHESFVERTQTKNVLNDGARELLASLQGRSIPFGILTYGSYEWQLLKLRAAGLSDVPYLITEVSGKGRLLRSWVNADNYIILPNELGGYYARSIVMVDDKVREFNDTPLDLVKGYVLRPKNGLLLPSQQGVVPNHLNVVESLRDIKV